MIMKKELIVIESNVSKLRNSQKGVQVSKTIPLEENLTIDDLIVKINNLCKDILKHKNVVSAWFAPPFNIGFSSENLINRAKVIIYYTQCNENNDVN